jgi:glycosyltransferase involved in cell wall biosynthesis
MEKIITLRRVGTPIISVIVPTLNEEKYVEKALESIKNQNFKKYELILSDGNSKDGTVKIARKYVDKIFISSRRSIATQFNNGVNIARGETLVFIHADSWVAENFLEEVLKATNNGFIGGGCKTFWDRKELRYKILEIITDLINFLLNRFNIISVGYVYFFKKDVVKKVGLFRDLINYDIDMFARIRKFGKIIRLKDTFAITSTRRLEKYGFVSTNLKWLIAGLLIFLGKKMKTEYPHVS